MNKKDEYTGSKVRNQFTAYLLGFIRGKRRDYLKKKIKTSNTEMSIDEFTTTEIGKSIEESIETERKEMLLLSEAQGVYPEWDELTDQKLLQALMKLREDERKLIYQHVFEERTFDEMSLINGLPSQRVKGVYFYAIRKIRKMMGGE